MAKKQNSVKMIALCRNGRKGNLTSVISEEYSNKHLFGSEIRGNGIRCLWILTESEYELIANRDILVPSNETLAFEAKYPELVVDWVDRHNDRDDKVLPKDNTEEVEELTKKLKKRSTKELQKKASLESTDRTELINKIISDTIG